MIKYTPSTSTAATRSVDYIQVSHRPTTAQRPLGYDSSPSLPELNEKSRQRNLTSRTPGVYFNWGVLFLKNEKCQYGGEARSF